MRANEILQEVPLPQEWDKDIYKSNVPFKKRIEYAKQMAKKVGAGSSRVAFEIEFEGRPTILKIAKNTKGLAQNDFEAQTLNDYYVRALNIAIPIIDYDEENSMPTWVLTEKAQKMTPTLFKKHFSGLDPHGLVYFATVMTGKVRSNRVNPSDKVRFEEILENNEAASSFVDLVGNYDIPSDDFKRVSNWGIYNGGPVIIDLGLSSEVLQKHYS